MFIRSPWDEKNRGQMESCQALEQLKGYVGELEVVMGDDALDWNIDDYFFGGLDVRRDRYPFFGADRRSSLDVIYTCTCMQLICSIMTV